MGRGCVRSVVDMSDLSKKRVREHLLRRRAPHYMRLAEGAYLGFRRGPDTWHARYRSRDCVQHYRALRDVPTDDYDADGGDMGSSPLGDAN